jgi:hypothetical protein
MVDYPHWQPTEEFPGRPESLDFDVLSAVIVAMDAEADSAPLDGEIMVEIVRRYIDPDALTYAAMQRAVRALKITKGDEVQARINEVMTCTTIYYDAFITGCMYQQTRKTKGDKPNDPSKSGDPRKRATKTNG